jgi:hypothetical protein
MLAAIRDLRKISHHCLLGQPLPSELSHWLGSSLQQFLAHRARSIEAAFGIRAPRGGVPWWLEEAMRVRDAALRALAATFMVGQSVSTTARHIHDLAVRYAASAWRFDRQRPDMPTHYAGTPHELLWKAFKSGAPMPIGARQLRKVLARQEARPRPPGAVRT